MIVTLPKLRANARSGGGEQNSAYGPLRRAFFSDRNSCPGGWHLRRV